MKHIVAVSKAFLLIAVFASFTACSGGAFSDPGHDGSGLTGDGGTGGSNGGDSGGGKPPATLSSGASYQEAKAKLDEIIDYCDKHPGAANSSVKNGVEAFKSTAFSYMTESTWTGTTASQAIEVINEFIKNLT
jgi:hypothetical protein